MNKFQSQLADNPLRSRADYEQALLDILKPVYQLMHDEGKLGRVRISDSGAVYDEPRREIEGFMRTLWGVGPLCSTPEHAAKYHDYYDAATAGILAGVDPDSPWYWGELGDYDQLFVEMGSLATMLILTKDFFWAKLSDTDQKHLYRWLNQINQHTIPPTNWLFFRVLVNSFFQHVGLPLPADQPANDLKELDSYYLNDGWYFDGYNTQIDYYIPFGMQYYGVLYSKLAADPQEEHVAKFRQRAVAFAQTFKDWFVQSGESLPFGRSQTYRFAQSAFWSVAGFAKLPLEQPQLAPTLLRRNMHWWFTKPIFNDTGLLTIGYGYPNLVMAEGYNAPGSPYWAMKNFINLALPEDDPFWQGKDAEFASPQRVVNPYSHMLLVHSADGEELQAFTAGQHSHEHAHGESKYEKYVYSTTFGFSVAKGSTLPKQGGFDNTLALSESDYHYQTAFGYADYAVHDDYVYSRWEPWSDTTVQNFVVPAYPWHLRVHVIDTKRALNAIEGSFSAPADGRELLASAPDQAYYTSSVGTTGIVALTTNTSVEVTQPEPNTNMLYPRTALPQLTTKLPVGRTVLIDACLGDAGVVAPTIETVHATLTGDQLRFTIGATTHTVSLNELKN